MLAASHTNLDIIYTDTGCSLLALGQHSTHTHTSPNPSNPPGVGASLNLIGDLNLQQSTYQGWVVFWREIELLKNFNSKFWVFLCHNSGVRGASLILIAYLNLPRVRIAENNFSWADLKNLGRF